jgi:signal peptidase II
MTCSYLTRKNVFIFLLLIVSVVAIDQWTKGLISLRMDLYQSIRVFGNAVRVTYIRNPHAAFGISLSDKIPILPLTFIAIVLLLIFFHLQRGFVYQRYALSMIFGGAVGNLIDRIRFGEVIDFIDVGIGSYRWPVFNVADSCVTVGLVLLFWGAWRVRRLPEHSSFKTGEEDGHADPPTSTIHPV